MTIMCRVMSREEFECRHVGFVERMADEPSESKFGQWISTHTPWAFGEGWVNESWRPVLISGEDHICHDKDCGWMTYQSIELFEPMPGVDIDAALAAVVCSETILFVIKRAFTNGFVQDSCRAIVDGELGHNTARHLFSQVPRKRLVDYVVHRNMALYERLLRETVESMLWNMDDIVTFGRIQ